MHIPEGYRLFEFVDPFEELVGPLCFKEDEDGRLRFAFEAAAQHANTAGQIHGGMLMTFADYALCLGAIHGLPDERCVTVSLSCEFTAPGQVGGLHRIDRGGRAACPLADVRAWAGHGRRAYLAELQRHREASAPDGLWTQRTEPVSP